MEQEVICIDSDEPVAPTRRKKQKQEPRKQRTPAQRNATAAALRRAQVDQVDLCSTEELDDEDYGPGPSPKPKQRRRKAAAADLDESPSPTQQKKQKKPRKAKEPKEKRTNEYGVTVRYSATPSQATYDRMQRALPGSGHRMFLLSTKELAPAGAPGGRAQEFSMTGATGNVYTVKVCRHPHCTCPDHAKGHVCKHILFVMLRVLKLSTTNPLAWQKALLTKEVEEVLSGAHSQGAGVDEGVLAKAGVLRAWRAASGEAAADEEAAAGSSVGNRRPVEGDCPICFCSMEDEPEVALVWCKNSCGNNMHKECFAKWAASKEARGEQTTCVYCRAAWASEAAAPAGGYMNLAAHTHEYDEGVSLQELYPNTASWIQHHSAGWYSSRGGAARMARSGGGSGRRRR